MYTRFISIYALTDPNTGEDRYVGQTSNCVEGRIDNHKSVARLAVKNKDKKPLSEKDAWISSLLERGQEPGYRVLHWFETHSFTEPTNVEREWIARRFAEGARLTNVVCNPACRIGSRWVAVPS